MRGCSFIKGPCFSTSKIYDVAVIGGGSAGLAFAFVYLCFYFYKEGAKLGLDIAVFDYVAPSSQGTKWGLGGTCVNVGCIPKKLMHQSSLIREQNESANLYGWEKAVQQEVNWQELTRNVQDYIKGLNYGYKSNLAKNKIHYLNEMATFKNSDTLYYGDHQQIEEAHKNQLYDNLKELKFKYCVICTGGRPTQLPQISEHAITSDDIFWMNKSPGKTLVVGGGYIALECGGFLQGMGYDVSIMTRGKYLREFDQGIADQILKYYLRNTKVNIVPNSLPISVTKDKENKFLVKWQNTINNNEQGEDQFDTLLMAVGRTANTKNLNLDKIGVKVNPSNQKILGNYGGELERTENENIFALGDVLQGVPELTPIASKSGQLLARRINMKLKGNFTEKDYCRNLMDYNDFPTTVFTPLEYSCVGLSEEQAEQRLGADSLEVYHSKFVPLEESLCDKVNEDFELLQKDVYCKIICDKRNNEQVVGMHYLGPNAGEVMQGFAVAMKLGLNYETLCRTVGIHPTCAEEFTQLKITKKSGEDHERHGC